MKTVLENLRVESQRLRDLLRDLLAHSSIRRWHNPNVDGFVYVGKTMHGTSSMRRGYKSRRRFWRNIADSSRSFELCSGNRPRELLGNLSRRILQFLKSFSSRQRSTQTTQTNILRKPSPLSSHKSNCWKVSMDRVMRSHSWCRIQML
jgi:hypothetical protein